MLHLANQFFHLYLINFHGLQAYVDLVLISMEFLNSAHFDANVSINVSGQ